MAGDQHIENADRGLAMALGLYALGDATIQGAAKAGDVTRWELETAIDDAGLAEALDLNRDADVKSELDNVFDDRLD